MKWPRWLTRTWRSLRQAERLEALRAENANLRITCDLLEALRAENANLRITCDLLVDREKNLKANLALALSEAGRLHAQLRDHAQSTKGRGA